MKELDLKAIIFAVTGTGVSITLANVLPWVSLVAGLSTIAFTLLRIIDWIEARRDKQRLKAD